MEKAKAPLETSRRKTLKYVIYILIVLVATGLSLFFSLNGQFNEVISTLGSADWRYVLIIFGEAITNAVGYSSASLVAPKAFTTQMMTVWSMSQSTGAALSTLAVNFYHEGSEANYFLMIGGITCVVGLLVMIFAKKIEKGMGLADTSAAK